MGSAGSWRVESQRKCVGPHIMITMTAWRFVGRWSTQSTSRMGNVPCPVRRSDTVATSSAE
eukprot:6045817-Prymnesium_polylepis.1